VGISSRPFEGRQSALRPAARPSPGGGSGRPPEWPPLFSVGGVSKVPIPREPSRLPQHEPCKPFVLGNSASIQSPGPRYLLPFSVHCLLRHFFVICFFVFFALNFFFFAPPGDQAICGIGPSSRSSHRRRRAGLSIGQLRTGINQLRFSKSSSPLGPQNGRSVVTPSGAIKFFFLLPFFSMTANRSDVLQNVFPAPGWILKRSQLSNPNCQKKSKSGRAGVAWLSIFVAPSGRSFWLSS